MAKQKSIWSCVECGHNHSRWLGQCPQCRNWDTFREEEVKPTPATPTARYAADNGVQRLPKRISELSSAEIPRIDTGLPECNRLFGGGVVPGALTLIGGDPGIGKSTLMLQLADSLARQGHLVLYVCGEESLEQTSLRARRLGISSDSLLLLSETSFANIRSQIEALSPSVLILDSIQIAYKPEIASAPGSVIQVREIASECMHLAKGRQMATFLIGHVTKGGEIAGPRILEHLVDTVLYFEGDRHHQFRIVRSVKNRFGSTDEIAVFQMEKAGLREIANPSQLFLEQRMPGVTGSAIVPAIEGSRPYLIESQALVTETVFPSPSRRSTGIDVNRLSLLLAVLEKRVKYPLFRCDVFASVVGGMRICEPALDLGLIAAIASSFRNIPIAEGTLFFGEVGLSGEVRAVPRMESRLKEGAHLGFTRCVLPKANLRGIAESDLAGIQLVPVRTVEEAIDAAFG